MLLQACFRKVLRVISSSFWIYNVKPSLLFFSMLITDTHTVTHSSAHATHAHNSCGASSSELTSSKKIRAQHDSPSSVLHVHKSGLTICESLIQLHLSSVSVLPTGLTSPRPFHPQTCVLCCEFISSLFVCALCCCFHVSEIRWVHVV